MTVSVDAGITQAALKSLGSYKDLFGGSIASMLLVVLTVNQPANHGDLQDYLNLNWPTIAGLDSRIKERNVFCVSLDDLRNNKDTVSYATVEEIASICRGMPLKLIEALALRYRTLKEALLKKTGDVEKMVKSYIDEGWQAFDHLTSMYEQSPYVKMADKELGWMDGFVCKRTSHKRRTLALASGGLVNVIRKDAIHIHTKGKIAEEAWESFYKKHAVFNHSWNLMRLLGDHLFEKGLAVMVRDLDMTHVGTLRVKRYCVTIFHPVSYTHEQLYAYLQDVVNETSEGLRTEVITDLAKSIIPAAVRSKRKGDREKRKSTGSSSANVFCGVRKLTI